ncbi:MAG: sugar ABC transporter substrate-binding protein [Lachnospiraceae bacterium]|nr:sugar ABC transporter substrate-binding protein [Lachnospiraceae bacterium]
MKRLLMLVLVCSMLTGIAACGSNGSSSSEGEKTEEQEEASKDKEKITIGVLFDFLSVESRVRQRDTMTAYAEEMGVELVFQNANGDEKVQLQQGENLISQNVDAIAILAQNSEACISLAKQAKEAGIPFIVTDRLIENTDIDYYVGYDNNAIGHLQADWVYERCPKGNYVLLSGASTDPNCKIWHDGWMDVLQEGIDSGDINIVLDEKCDNWDPNNALKHMENALTATGDQIDVVLCMNDGLGLGVNQALEAAGLQGKVLMTGLDGESVAFQRIAEGKQSMTILINDTATGRAIIDTAIAAAKGEEPEVNDVIDNGFKEVPAVLVDLIPVDNENLLDIIKEGYVDYDVVFENVPEADRPARP